MILTFNLLKQLCCDIIDLRLIILLSTRSENGDRIAGFLFEPIQGEAGVCMTNGLDQL